MPLQINVGQATHIGAREHNEDYAACVTPEASVAQIKGALLAIADGVGGGAAGREAAEYTVRGVLSDYYATPDTWEVPFALDKILTAINRWLRAQASSRRESTGMATTLSALILRGSRYYTAHVGDSRIYRLRGEQLQQLTNDHVWDRPNMQHVLKRAVGLDDFLSVDYGDGDLAADDVFCLVTDGIWEPLGELALHELLHLHRDPQRAADALVETATKRGGQDNASAVVAKIVQAGDESLHDFLAEGKTLPLPARLKPGAHLDDFEVLALLHESRASVLYQVRHTGTRQVGVLKTLQAALADDAASCAGLLMEEWLAKRVLAHYFPQVVPLAPGARSALYYVMSYHEGATLQQRLDQGQHFSVADVTQIGIRLLKGLSALHRLHIIHRDIKPANLHSGADGKLRILDLGVALNPWTAEGARGNAGTPSFIAPELFGGGGVASTQTDLYAAGVTLYHLLTRKYPYGEIEPFQHPRFGEPAPPTRYRPDIPQWLENILLKAVARDPQHRFETVEEMLLALERGEMQPLAALPPTPLMERNPLAVWQGLALLSFVLNLLLLYWLLAGA
ncbi:MAG: protein kinase domain-containing protein [Burkholderiales bacterium]